MAEARGEESRVAEGLCGLLIRIRSSATDRGLLEPASYAACVILGLGQPI